ncbi:hypothetical protein SAMN04488074_112167 [Lentzea albidocapillata subsp. violacea]|uniref:Uncharacterized protein n=1 Tax=Lentzea albidocapillata subsp. violacea TaxID=128104 RepID=A0A1G9LS96_9PSEU|nr:hypothetical protein [Lentzea albidocapillata]SDL64819.1 hypothetical protein SAMN04488074_112167 [Lentzea albidocapillata subsp. violacea]
MFVLLQRKAVPPPRRRRARGLLLAVVWAALVYLGAALAGVIVPAREVPEE